MQWMFVSCSLTTCTMCYKVNFLKYKEYKFHSSTTCLKVITNESCLTDNSETSW